MSTFKGTLPTGHRMIEIDGDEGDEMRKIHFCFSDGVMRCQPGGWLLPTNYQKCSTLHNFEFRKSDLIVSAFSKSGTTWVQEIVWNLVKNPNLDNDEAKKAIDSRFAYFEGAMVLSTTGIKLPDEKSEIYQSFRELYPDDNDLVSITMKVMANASSPRFIKLHIPLPLLADNILERCKIIYIARSMRDVACSLYHFSRLQVLRGFTGSLDQFVNHFVSDKVMFSPYYEHMKEAWDCRDHPNMLFLFYEDLKADPVKEVRKVDQFLGTNRNEKQINNIVEFTSFEAVKNRSKLNPPTSNGYKYFNKEFLDKEGGFYRKGVIGDWKNLFNEEQLLKLKDFEETNLKNFGPDFKYNREKEY